MRRARTVATWSLALAAAAAASACGGGTAPPPEPGTMRGLAPDLRGMRVLVLPVQNRLAVPGDPDAELAFGLRARGAGVEWIFPAEVEEILARTPAMDASTHGLPVSAFLMAEVQRVGDPLYGELRRMAALVDAQVVLLPVQAALEPVPGDDPRVRFWTALIDARTGRVAWFSVLEGGSYPQGDPRALASAVDEVTRMLLWYVGA
ncbi:MAG TPA: hypothetical protein VFQ22_01180 [Longimicrobiales bacterium]|nr:hypothetical protein [Longimicrobiales bacterium]